MTLLFTFGVHSLGMLERTRTSLAGEGFTVREVISTMGKGKDGVPFELHTLVAVPPPHAPVKFTRAGGV